MRGFFRHVVLLSLVVLSGCQEQILHDLSEPEANRVISRFSGTDIVPSKVSQSDGRWAIAVPHRDAAPALSFLDSHRVLSSRAAIGSQSTKSGLVPSREEQWFSYQRAVSQSIEETLNTLAGVLEAHVHVNLPEHDPLLGRTRDVGGTGSVLLVIDERYTTKDEEVSALVAGAAGLSAASVTVLRSVAARNAGSASSPPEPATIQPAPVADTTVRLDPARFMEWVSPEVACAGTASLACGVAGLVAVRRRSRKRTRFSLPVESHHES